MPRDAATKKPHKTSRAPKAQCDAQKAAKKAAASTEARDIAARLAAQLDGPKKPAGKKPYGEKSGKPGAKPAVKAAGRKDAFKKDAPKKDAPKKSEGKKAADKKPAVKAGAKPASKKAVPAKESSAKKPTAKKPAPKKHESAAVAVADRMAKARKSPCAVDAQCGGCKTIAVPYMQQLLLKNAQIVELFDQLDCDFELRPILGMEDPFRYRNKIISPFAPGKKIKAPEGEEAGKKRRRGLTHEILTGMYEQGTHKLVPTNECLIENAVGQQVVSAVKAIMEKHAIEPYNEDTGEGFVRHVVVRVGHESGEVLVTLVTNEEEFPAGKSFAKELIAKVPAVTTVVQNVNTRQTNVILGEQEQVLYGPGFILDTLCGLSFRISSTSFYQVNAVQTEVLYNTAIELAGLTGVETVIDAYCGTGTIGLVAASRGARAVIGVESVEAAVRDARENARHNGIENATFVAADATEFMLDLVKDGADFDAANMVLLMDPPRAGSTPEFLQAAAQLGPSRIVYVSCNPETQVRDIALLQKHGYQLRIVQPVDMFPHTDHVETVVLLTK